MYATQIVKNVNGEDFTMAALVMQVNGFQFQGKVYIDGYEVPKIIGKGVPSQLLERFSYKTSYNKETRTPNWVGWALTSEHTDGEYARKGHSFIEDLDVPLPRAIPADIRESECGYQRGHMCPAEDNKWSYKAQKDAFLMTNTCPQNGNLNQHDWKYLEEAYPFPVPLSVLLNWYWSFTRVVLEFQLADTEVLLVWY